MIRTIVTVFILALIPVAAFGAEIQVDDTSLDASTHNWTADNTYILNGHCFLEAGGVLNIEAGTVIKGKAKAEGDTTSPAAALIICRDAQIFAEGTAANPIIFTVDNDDVTSPTDLTLPARGKWGGLIILGNAQINTTDGWGYVEGLPEQNRSKYGGDDDADNSGVLKYVSVRHGGDQLSSANEINGVTFGAVGSGTVVDYVEVFNNLDDGFEWFGGTVNCKHLVSSFNGDDSFDYDEGFRGKGQFWFAVYSATTGDRGGEHDGGTDPEDGTPLAQAKVWNATYIGSYLADGDTTNAKNGDALKIRDNAGAVYKNSIFMGFQEGIDIEDVAESEADSRNQLEIGNIVIDNNIFYSFQKGSTVSDICSGDDYTITAWNDSWNNDIADPQLKNLDRSAYNTNFDPRPATASPAWINLAGYPDDWYTEVSYRGAFGNNLWVKGWTALDHYGYLTDLEEPQPNIVQVYDESLVADNTYNWTSDNTYILNGHCFLEAGGTLNIEAGTVIKGKAKAEGDTTSPAAALIICRDAQINAEGTQTDPIIFTVENDDLSDATDLTLPARGKWGGLIILGNATINTTDGWGYVEGLPEQDRSKYGGSNDEDNSGTLKYVSVRHGGDQLSSANEINGVTFGAVGSGTVVDYVEVFNNLDDGFEWFGGTVNCKHLISSFNGDDSFDYDEGFRGKGQFWFAIYSATTGDRGGEHDGGTDPEDGTPLAQAKVMNATYIGSYLAGGDTTNAKNGDALKIRDNAGAVYKNSIFMGFQEGIDIEDVAESEADSRNQLEIGNIVIDNNLFYSFQKGNTVEAICSGDDYTITAWNDTWNNEIADPELMDLTRDPYIQSFDPRPGPASPAWNDNNTNMASYDDSWYTTVTYRGAFGQDVWAKGWTALDAYGYLNASYDPIDPVSVNDLTGGPAEFTITQNSPNPFNPTTTINFTLAQAGHVKMDVYNVAGQKVDTIIDNHMHAGTHSVVWNAAQFGTGIYFCRVQNEGVSKIVKMTLVK